MIQAHYIQAHLLLCVLVPNRPGPEPVCDLEVRGPWSGVIKKRFDSAPL